MTIADYKQDYKTNELRKEYGRITMIVLAGARRLRHLDNLTAEASAELSECEKTIDLILQHIPENLTADYTPKLEIAPIYNAAHDKFTAPAAPKNVRANAQKTKNVLEQAQTTQKPQKEKLDESIEFLYALADVYLPWADTPHQI